MSHVVYPEGEGFVVAGVWRSETEAVTTSTADCAD